MVLFQVDILSFRFTDYAQEMNLQLNVHAVHVHRYYMHMCLNSLMLSDPSAGLTLRVPNAFHLHKSSECFVYPSNTDALHCVR